MGFKIDWTKSFKEDWTSGFLATEGFNPTNLAGLRLWLDADDAPTVKDAAGAVFQWNDKSGNGNHATQGTSAAQPTTGLNTQNGRNVINGANGDYMLLPSGMYSITNGDNTVFAVSRRTTETGSLARVINATEAGASRHYIQYGATAGTVNYLNGTSTAAGVAGVTNTNFNIIRGRKTGTLLACAVNGAVENTSNTGSNEAGVDAMAIFAQPLPANYLIGDIAEIIVYQRYLSDSECLKVENYLSNKWGI